MPSVTTSGAPAGCSPSFCKRLSLLGVSDAVRDDMRRCLPKWPAARIQTLYNRIDLDATQASLVSREEARQTLGLDAHAWIVGNVGRLHPDKDQATLLRGFAAALKYLPANSQLAILGKGRLEQDLRALALELGIADRVLLLGQVPEARRYFRAFDVFALSSDHEPFGMVLLEAMAAGVPLLATACGGARKWSKASVSCFRSVTPSTWPRGCNTWRPWTICSVANAPN